MAYFYVQEDDLASGARFPRWAKDHPIYSVYEADIDRETLTYGPGRWICSGLGLDQVKWFHSFPETRQLLMDEWRHMQEHNTWYAGVRLNLRLSKLVAEARERHGPEEMPEQLYLRSDLDRLLGPGGG